MNVELKSGHVTILLVLGAIVAYWILSLRLSQNLAVALAMFGTCVVGLFVFAFRTAMKDRQQHGHGHDH